MSSKQPVQILASGGVVVSDPLPTGMSFDSFTGTNWSCSGAGTPPTVTCSLGVPLEEHISNVITFMRERAEELGLKGSLER